METQVIYLALENFYLIYSYTQLKNIRLLNFIIQ